jgi:hypothetical protein
MNVRIHYTFNFTAGFYFDGMLHMNNYSVRLWMMTATDNNDNHNIAFDRIKFFVSTALESGVFINREDEEQCRLFADCGLKIITLPDEPVDQLIGIMLYCKLNALCEDRMIVGEVEINSELGDEITYIHGDDEDLGPYAQDGWWHDCNLVHYDNKITETDNIMSLNTSSSWRDLSLQWPVDEEDAEQYEDTSNTIVFGNFSKDDTK